MNGCGPKRFNGMAGSLVPGALGVQDFGNGQFGYQEPYSMGEQDEFSALGDVGGLGLPTSGPSQSVTGKQNQWAGLLPGLLKGLGVGAMAGLGGPAGMAMSPILALLMSGALNPKGQQQGSGGGGLSSLLKIFGGGGAPASAQTPKFNPNGK